MLHERNTYSEFRKYNQSSEECFVINKDLFPKDTSLVYIGLWYVPSRNKASFEFNNPDIPEYLLYKVTQCEPQIWAFVTGADTLAVACPSCLTMLTDAVKAEDLDGKLAVKDISQIVRESLLYK